MKNILLIGYRATGKSTVGRQLARRLEWTFVDTDSEIESRTGQTIAEIFTADGERRFRDLESQVLAETLNQRETVIAAGGGAVMREANRMAIRDAESAVVWLQASPETITARLASDEQTAARRPALSNHSDVYSEVATLLERRNPVYQQCAQLVIDTQHNDPAAVADEIIRRLSSILPQEPS